MTNQTNKQITNITKAVKSSYSPIPKIECGYCHSPYNIQDHELCPQCGWNNINKIPNQS